MQFSQFFFILH